MTTANVNTGRDIYQDVTDRICAALEAGVAPWVKPWSASGDYSLPWNPASGTRYRGINVPLLWIAEAAAGYGCSQWMTYKQAKERGGQVRAGEKATHIIFWKLLDQRERQPGVLESEDQDRARFVLRTYCVFNIAQIDGIEPVRAAELPGAAWEPSQRADALMANSRADIRHGGDRAAFHPALDYVMLPAREQFADAGAYYGTALHELTHWTGHQARLNRDFTGRFGSDRYAAEELVAELGAAYTCAALGICGQLQHAEYIANWLTVLRNDKRAIFTAASHAQKAADYLLANDPAALAVAA